MNDDPKSITPHVPVVDAKVEATTLPPAERGKNGFTKVGPSVESEPYDLFHLDEGVFES